MAKSWQVVVVDHGGNHEVVATFPTKEEARLDHLARNKDRADSDPEYGFRQTPQD